MPIPFLILSDAPTSGTGLGRITRDLATRIAQHLPDMFRVGTLGYGGEYSRALPFPQYNAAMDNWVVLNLPEVWRDFAGDEPGIVLTIWDASRMLWFSRPENCTDPRLQKFLTNPPFKRWGYFPIDATGPNDRLTAVLGHIISGSDRVLCYSEWAARIVERTLVQKDGKLVIGGVRAHQKIDALPHGIDTSIFYPRDRERARREFGERMQARSGKGTFLTVPDDATLIGIVATNQVRKDWGLAVETVSQLKDMGRKVVLWAHTDTLERHWSLPALLNDFGGFSNTDTVLTVKDWSDEEMAWFYSACDVTLGIGLGEGWGFPIFESLACGTPCIHGNYGGAPEHMDEWMLVQPNYTFRVEGPYNCLRPVFHPDRWVGKIEHWVNDKLRTSLPQHLDWQNLWPRWEAWLRAGVK